MLSSRCSSPSRRPAFVFTSGRGAAAEPELAAPPATAAVAKQAKAPAVHKTRPWRSSEGSGSQAQGPKAKAPAKAAPKKVVPKIPPTGFPLAVDRALAQHKVVVVSLVVPGSHVDELAAGEAKAGAKLGGAGYLALNVLNERVAHAVLAKLDGRQGAQPARSQAVGRGRARARRLRRPRDGRSGRRERRPVSSVAQPERELFVRHARKDGRSVAVLRAVDHGDSCIVEAEVYPAGAQSR